VMMMASLKCVVRRIPDRSGFPRGFGMSMFDSGHHRLVFCYRHILLDVEEEEEEGVSSLFLPSNNLRPLFLFPRDFSYSCTFFLLGGFSFVRARRVETRRDETRRSWGCAGNEMDRQPCRFGCLGYLICTAIYRRERTRIRIA
jgi:hypothetical protein